MDARPVLYLTALQTMHKETTFSSNIRLIPGGASNHQPILRTTHPIPADREIFANYGSDYWR
jgi:hypothetical protein